LTAASAARLGRAFAAIVGDSAWREEATKRLLVAGSDPDETASLWFELGRSRLLRGDVSGAEDALHRLSKAQGEPPFARAAWLSRVLAVAAIPFGNTVETDRTTMQEDIGEAAARGKDPKAFDDLALAEPDA